MRQALAFGVLLALPMLAGEPPRDGAARLLEAVLARGRAPALLEELTDSVGPRLSGSPGADAAVRWALARFAQDGVAAHAERVMVPHWVRGVEEAALVAPVAQRLAVTALGGSIGTGAQGVTADVVEVASFDELKALGAAAVRGRIVLFNKAIVPGSGFEGYSAVATLRTTGAVEAARLGAIGSLVRSLGTLSARLPHTGAMDYDGAVAKIPSAALAAEDADLVHRLLARGERVRLRLTLGCETRPDVESANVVAELPGRASPEQIVLIGGHLDSWDLGTGAIDDGAGVAIAMDTLRLMKAEGLTPRRTVRAILYMNEENGLRGAEAYAKDHASELARHVAALEADAGAARALGFRVNAGAGGLENVAAFARLLRTIGADAVDAGVGGADISAFEAAGVPLVGLRQDATHYFDWHHSAADTFDKVDAGELLQAEAAFATMTYALADAEATLPRPEPKADAGR